ncbi:methanogenesis marker 3 protein [Methanosarcinaceae archaeon]|nr:methanogenesis marker 3 protein [Methanosarcinaceae archaeon]
MTEQISILADGVPLSLPAGSSILDVLAQTGSPYVSGSAVCIIKKKDAEVRPTTAFTLKTSGGILTIELKDPSSPSSKIWVENYEKLVGLPLHWGSPDALAFGPFKSSITPVKGMMRCRKNDVLLGAGGFDSADTHLIFCRKEHYAEYGADSDGVFATLIAGRRNLEKITAGTVIESIEPVLEKEDEGDGICTTDLDTVLEDGDTVTTYIEAEMSLSSPHGAENFYALITEGTFTVSSKAKAFCSDDTLIGEPCEYENFEPRSVGAISVRSSGEGRSRVYISTADRASSLVHSVIGHVTKGISLPVFAQAGQKITVDPVPPQILLLGHTLEEARPLLEKLKIDLHVNGYEGEGNVIVRQDPASTIEILGKGEVTVTSVPLSSLIEVTFYYDKAPKSVEFFRHAIELKTHPIGVIPVSMVYDDTFIFKAEKEAERYKEILPENTPGDLVRSGELGITNQSAKRMGYVGVRLADEDLFGPTGEKFSATNIIGKVLTPEKLRGLGDGDVVYVKEILPSGLEKYLAERKENNTGENDAGENTAEDPEA